jgi:hypothetical protein
MAWSGKTGQVYAEQCTRNPDGTYNPAEASTRLIEVLYWEADIRRNVESYGASSTDDTLQGWENVCIGTGSVQGTIRVKLAEDLALDPDYVYSLLLENAAVSLSGMAAFEGTPVSTKIDGGQGVEVTYRFKSHGAWSHTTGTQDDGNL